MAKLLQFDKKHFNSELLIPLKRGDDWSLEAQLIEKKGNYVEPMDLTGKSATAWFGGDCNLENPAPVTVIPAIINADCGKLRIDVAASATLLAGISENGSSVYVTVSENDGSQLETIETDGEVVQVLDRGFRSF